MNISRTIPIFLIATILVFGTTISMGIPSASFAQSYEDSYTKDKKVSNLNNQKVNCNNVIINGIDSPVQGTGDMLGDMTNEENDGTGQWLGNNGDEKESNGIDNNIVNFCKNKHNKVVLTAEEEPPVREEPTTGSLTVKKEIFGCVNMDDETGANCQPLDNDDPNWLSCDNTTISNLILCQELQENLFDIEVLDEQNNQIQQFLGSAQGITLQNLEPGTYTVNEIRHQSSEDQLGEFGPTQTQCTTQQNFPEGGQLIKQDPMIDYRICFEYEDEQGNDCTTNTIAAGEAKTCIVKNYISGAAIELLP